MSQTKIVIDTRPVTITIEGDDVATTEALALWRAVIEQLDSHEGRLQAGGFGFAHTELGLDGAWIGE